jgi:hypothetical protein
MLVIESLPIMLSLSKKSNLAIVRDFKKKVSDYATTFQEVDVVDEQRDSSFRTKGSLTEQQIADLYNRFLSQREELLGLHDRVSAIFEKYDIAEEFGHLLTMQPGDVTQWAKIKLSDKYVIQLDDSLVQLIAAIEKTPPFPAELGKYILSVWDWLDSRGVAKWIVVAILVLVCLAIMRLMGYDLNGLIKLVKAVRGEKELVDNSFDR